MSEFIERRKYFYTTDHGWKNYKDWLLPIHDAFVDRLKTYETENSIHASKISLTVGYYDEKCEVGYDTIDAGRLMTTKLDIDLWCQSFIKLKKRDNCYCIIMTAYEFVQSRGSAKRSLLKNYFVSPEKKKLRIL